MAAAQAAEKRLDNLQATAIQIKFAAEQAVEARAEMLGPFLFGKDLFGNTTIEPLQPKIFFSALFSQIIVWVFTALRTKCAKQLAIAEVF